MRNSILNTSVLSKALHRQPLTGAARGHAAGRFLVLAFSLISGVMARPANAAILLEGGSTGDAPATSRVRSLNKTADEGLTLRKLRRVGIGMTGAGPLGVAGLNLELNFSPEYGLMMGLGGGPGYQSFTFEVKKVLGGRAVLPYVGMGYARWYNRGDAESPVGDTNPTFLKSKFLNQKQQRAGLFTENLIYPALGLQYMHLSGPWAGSSVFAELVLLADINDFVVAPTGTLGYMYYF